MKNLPEQIIIARRKVVIIVADGYDPIAFNAVYGAIQGASAITVVLRPCRATILPLVKTVRQPRVS